VGVSYSIFQDVDADLPHFESKWLQSVRSFLQGIGGRLRLDNPFIPKIQRVNDTFIMDNVLTSRQFTAKQTKNGKLLQVVYASDNG